MDISFITFWSGSPGESNGESFAANLNDVSALDETGWDGVWLGGVPSVHGGNDPHPLVLASAVAALTSRIKIGTAVHLPGLKALGERFVSEVRQGASTIDRGSSTERRRYIFEHLLPADPIQTAEQIGMVDNLSDGRFIYGAGGTTIGDEARQNQFFEFLEVMKKIWTEEEFSGFQGEYYNYPPLPSGARVGPRPVQKPHPPILLPIDSQQSFEPMGKMGYRIAIGGGNDLHNQRGDSVLKEDVEKYRQAWRDAGHPGNPAVSIRIPTLVSATKEEAIRNTEAIMESRRKSAAAGVTRPSGSTDLFGTPEEVVERIQELRDDFGADEIMCHMLGHMLPRESVRQSMRLIAEKVLPKVK